jgi:hypothetical protein
MVAGGFGPTIACGPAAPLLDAAVEDGVLCQVTEVFERNNPARAICAKWKKNKGFARAMVISQLNGRVLSKIKGMEIKVALAKGDYLCIRKCKS